MLRPDTPDGDSAPAAAGGRSWLRAGHPMVIAHRGQPVAIPEQTMASFAEAVRLGAEMIEADAQLSSDGQLLLMHDLTLERTTDGSGRVIDMTWERISRLDAGSWFGPRFAGLRVPRVSQLLDLAREAGISVCLEAKGADASEAARIAVNLARLVLEHDALDRAFVSSFHHPAIEAARRVAPDLLIAPERLPEHGPQSSAEVLRQARVLGAQVVQHRWELLTAEVVETLHEAGIAVWSWNANDAYAVRVSYGLGVDGVIGDDTALLVRMRERFADLWSGAQD